jgi:Cys-tRNA(Pro)/Cys-tRNA(Cys) deacylase
MAKTNAIRILESKGIEHSFVEYQSSEDEVDAITVANKINANPEMVFKTLVTVNEKNEHFVFVIPGPVDLNLKKAAAAADSKKIELIKVKDLLPLTGYIRGGCSPIGMKKLFPTYIDETAQLFEKIYCSAGIRGMQLLITPDDLAAVIEAEFADLTNY